jgi:long-chain acyl-CoA synthetase
MPPLGIYGMTESSGAVTSWTFEKARYYTCGTPIPGVSIKIDNPDKTGQGEVCIKARFA